MSALADRTAAQEPTAESGRDAPPSPAGPLDEGSPAVGAPGLGLAPLVQALRFGMRPMSFLIDSHRQAGDVYWMNLPIREGGFIVTCHPDHLRSLMTANPADAPSLVGESPLRQLLGTNSVLTSVGPRHMRQRKLLLPPFHGEAVQRYVEMIERVANDEIDRWPIGQPFALAPRMQAVTLAVIMRGVFGIDAGADGGRSEAPEDRLRDAVRRALAFTTTPLHRIIEFGNIGHQEPAQPFKLLLARVDREMYRVIAARRADPASEGRDDVLSLLLAARDEEGAPLTDHELRDELLALVLAGHETTANSLAWALERLLRTPAAYDRLRESVRGDDREDSAAYVEATIHETMRDRPVIPMIVRMVKRPWQLGPYVAATGSAVAISIVALHHRDDVYPDPQEFRPERFLQRKPGTYTWVPFGGGIRRCLGATLAMAEQRVVLEAIARRTDMVAPDQASEGARMRNVTMLPQRGCRLVVTDRRGA